MKRTIKSPAEKTAENAEKVKILQAYLAESYTHHFIISAYTQSLEKSELVFFFTNNLLELASCCTLDRNSKGTKTVLRVRPGIKFLRGKNLIHTGLTKKSLCEKYPDTNAGFSFENYIADRYNGKQNEKKNLARNLGGDVEINGVAYQIKGYASTIELLKQ